MVKSTLEIVKPIKVIRKHDFIRTISKELKCENGHFLNSLHKATTNDLKLVLDIIATVTDQKIKVTPGVREEDQLYVAKPRKRSEQIEDSGAVLLKLRLFCKKAGITIYEGELDTLAHCNSDELTRILEFLKCGMKFSVQNEVSSLQEREPVAVSKKAESSKIGACFKLLSLAVLIILGLMMSR
ncbi:TPA: hypothetical protein I7708_21815 [Vibrio vulnificus]|nr:hypothetical protein [Vibrio vulnificus]HAS8331281.1 hypothetical protein [Vibrio vulnificus]